MYEAMFPPLEELAIEENQAPITADNQSPVPTQPLETPVTSSASQASGDTSPITPPSSVETGYDSDRTDFLITSRSPCPDRGRSRQPSTLTRRYTNRSILSRRTLPVRRKLDFGMDTTATTPNGKDTLQELRLAERRPKHKWSYTEQVTLIAIYRWFKGQTADRTKTFNAIFGLNLPV
jgi:hypothetical protein